MRLCKGAYNEPEEVAYQADIDVDRSYVRCLKVLLAGQGYPMIATHDPRLIEIASSLASRFGRAQGSYEFQMLYGIRPEEQRRLVGVRRDRARLHPLRPGVVRLPHATTRRAPAEPVILPAIADLEEVGTMSQTAILGAGVMGETLLSGLVRAGRRVDHLLVGEKRPERARELEERYGVAVVGNVEAATKADTVAIVVKPQDMAELLDEIGPVAPRGPAAGLAGRRHHDRLHRVAGAQRCGGRPGHAEHPGARRRGHGRDLARARTATRCTSPRPRR